VSAKALAFSMDREPNATSSASSTNLRSDANFPAIRPQPSMPHLIFFIFPALGGKIIHSVYSYRLARGVSLTKAWNVKRNIKLVFEFYLGKAEIYFSPIN
jgi:hypothetical protein